MDTQKALLEEFKGQIVWAARDFPLDFHNRAEPAAVAARCSGLQGKFWLMYEKLFKNQRSLSDENFKSYAKQIGLNMSKFNGCISGSDSNQSAKAKRLVQSNRVSGSSLGVTGTPAFFIQGRRISGAQPLAEFRRIVKEELKKKD